MQVAEGTIVYIRGFFGDTRVYVGCSKHTYTGFSKESCVRTWISIVIGVYKFV
jgi:hypothetical protein